MILPSILDNIHQSGKDAQRITRRKTAPAIVMGSKKNLIVPLGCEDIEFSTGILKHDFGDKGANVLTSGAMRGCGKSTLTGTIFLDCMDQINMHKLIIDPKPEFYFRRNPTSRFKEELEHLNRKNNGLYNIKPKGHPNIKQITPACLYDPSYGKELLGIKHQLATQDMTYTDILTLLDLDSIRSNDIGMINRLDNVLFSEGDASSQTELDSIPMPTYTEIMNKLQLMDEKVLKRKFRNLMYKRAISKVESDKAPILKYLSQEFIVIFQTAFEASSGGSHSILIAYVANMLREVINDRTKYHKVLTDLKNKKLKPKDVKKKIKDYKISLTNPISIYFGEFDTYFPRNRNVATIDEIQSMYNNLRYTGIYLWGDTAHFHTLNPIAIKQSDVIFSFRIIDNKDMAALKSNKNIGGNHQYQLSELYFDKKSIPPAEVALIPAELDINERLMTFFPIPPMSEVQEEETISFKPLNFSESTTAQGIPDNTTPLINIQILNEISQSMPKQREILCCIRDAMDKNKTYTPRDVANDLGYPKDQYPSVMIKNLTEKGVIEIDDQKNITLPAWVYKEILLW